MGKTIDIAGLQCNVSVSTPEQRYVQQDLARTREDLTQAYVRFPAILAKLRMISMRETSKP